MPVQNLLSAHHLDIDTAAGRPLFRGLHMTLDHGDRVAIVGRNGVGKSSLLSVFAGMAEPTSGHVRCWGSRSWVPQQVKIHADSYESPGELRRVQLQAAFSARPGLLLLDEPTHDLDRAGITWLVGALQRFDGALLVVSHDRRVLRAFRDFFKRA